ncbi:hypothetical protein A1O1_02078 [Capronia coronata CBS 617.96]|uniref:Uncharacterized protein n=1 Tax=Capronia coronata CBS 617.96 TaxID=1182541 RepID=W9YWN0_9EURO|nr:uncharacterized protein A1O1_02078 [Capronia coronata CBS 617.96]EXJ93686.1 hypothetical protein A1O1_02078 [Capronia coronata CBS 617.96]
MASQHHSRKPSSRAGLPRRTTKGPLDAVDDLLITPGAVTPARSPSNHSPHAQSPPGERVEGRKQAASSERLQPSERAHAAPASDEQGEEDRDLSFLLDAAIYHSLSQLEVPGPFRRPFLPPPTSESSLMEAREQLDLLLSQCDFLRAAQLAGSILTSGTVQPNDAKSIFRLLSLRYSCLELSGNLLLAAQEAKALEDLSSAFYYDHTIPQKDGDGAGEQLGKVPHHIMPFTLRLQALRLQSIGFSDPRRGVTTLYDTALECREHLAASTTSPSQRALWTERLNEVSIRVVNSLIEMGDLDCAARTLESIKPGDAEHVALWTARMALLLIKIGDVSKAQRLIDSASLNPLEKLALESLLAVAEGRYDIASQKLSICELESSSALKGLVEQNLAVAYLYSGEVQKAKQMLEESVDNGYTFQTLTINLATIYDLTSDRARDLKMALAAKIAHQQKDSMHNRSFANVDFKL